MLQGSALLLGIKKRRREQGVTHQWEEEAIRPGMHTYSCSGSEAGGLGLLASAGRTLVVAAAVAAPLEASHTAARGSRASSIRGLITSLLDDLEPVVSHIFVIFILLLVARRVPRAPVVVVVVLLVSASHVLIRGLAPLLARRDALSALRVVALQLPPLVMRRLVLVPIENAVALTILASHLGSATATSVGPATASRRTSRDLVLAASLIGVAIFIRRGVTVLLVKSASLPSVAAAFTSAVCASHTTLVPASSSVASTTPLCVSMLIWLRMSGLLSRGRLSLFFLINLVNILYLSGNGLLLCAIEEVTLNLDLLLHLIFYLLLMCNILLSRLFLLHDFWLWFIGCLSRSCDRGLLHKVLRGGRIGRDGEQVSISQDLVL